MKLNFHSPKRISTWIYRLLSVLILFGLIVPLGPGAQAGRQVGDENAPQATGAGTGMAGIEMYKISPEWGLDYVTASGSAFVRLNGVNWSDIEPVEGGGYKWPNPSDPNSLDAQLARAAGSGLKVILVVKSAPKWAQKYKDPFFPCGPVASENFDEFGNFLVQLVTRYKHSVKYWELWNEPDVAWGQADTTGYYGCWGDINDKTGFGGSYYASMLQAVYGRIKSADTNAQVLIGGLLMNCDPTDPDPEQTDCQNDPSRSFLRGMFYDSEGEPNTLIFDKFDGIAFHSFDHYTPGTIGQFSNDNWDAAWNTTGPAIHQKSKYLRSLLNELGITGKNLYATETALKCTGACGTDYNAHKENFEKTKAFFVARTYSGTLAEGLNAAVWYAARANWLQTDLLTWPEGEPRPAYTAFQFSQQILAGAVYKGKLQNYTNVAGYVFSHGGRTIWVLWSADGPNHEIAIPQDTLNPLVEAYNVFGEDVPRAAKMTAKIEPTYLVFERNVHYVFTPLLRRDKPVINGSFELGLDSSFNPPGWKFINSGLPASLISTSQTSPKPDGAVPSGAFSVLLGRVDYPCSATGVPVGYAAAEQRVAVPSVAGTRLKFDYIMWTQDANPASFDRFSVFIDDGSGPKLVFYDGNTVNQTRCDIWRRIPDGSNWKSGSIDLSPYLGKTVTISFRNENRGTSSAGWFNTFTYLDNVEVSK